MRIPASRALSLDGKHFSFATPLAGLALRPGGYAAVGNALGQVYALALSDAPGARLVAGEGVILGREVAPFHDAPIEPAPPERVAAWLEEARPARAQLPLGELVLAPGVPFALDAGGFDRHTFLCGQSGSGKTYALGGILEQLLLATRVRIVVLDPNSDHVRLHELRDGVAPDVAAAYAEAAGGVGVRRCGSAGAERLRLRFGRLAPETQGALLRLDPVRDRDEYGVLLDLIEAAGDGQRPRLETLDRATPGGAQLAARARNLGVLRWDVWAGDDAGSLDDELTASHPRCLVVDLGSLPTRAEQALAATAVLQALWAARAQRRPTLIVIDEAHNVCPQAPEDAMTALATEIAVLIAGEGRKFGLHLLVASQRPQKVHENVVSQCDNLLLMRMNSVADLRHLETAFSFAPAGMLRLAGDFGLGQCLAAGKIASHPALVRVGSRLAEEGGADVGSDWAVPR